MISMAPIPRENQSYPNGMGFYGRLAIIGHFQMHADDYLMEILRKLNHCPSGSIDMLDFLNTYHPLSVSNPLKVLLLLLP